MPSCTPSPISTLLDISPDTTGPRDDDQPSGCSYGGPSYSELDDPTRDDGRAEERALARRPRTLGRYSLGDRIGKGGMGVVFSAFDPQLARAVAIKVVHPEFSSSPPYRRALLHDARAAARVTHPAVVRVYDWGMHGDQAFVVMELVRGSTLKGWLRAQPRRWSEIVRMFVRAGRGLQAVHEEGLVHRDFKPSNILIDAQGTPRVADFGLARPYASTLESTELRIVGHDEAIASARVAGTPRYMAPEQFIDEDVGPRSDQYSFCVCLYESLFGVHPLIDVDGAYIAHANIAHLHRTRRDRLRPSVPRAVVQAIVRGLAYLPEQRHPSLGALVAALDASVPTRRWRAAVVAMMATVALLAVWSGQQLNIMQARRCISDSERRFGPLRFAKQKADERISELGGPERPMVTAISEAMARDLEYLRAAARAACVGTTLLDGRAPERSCHAVARTELEMLIERVAAWDSDLYLAQELVLGLDSTSSCEPGRSSWGDPHQLHEMLDQMIAARTRLLEDQWEQARAHARKAEVLAQAAGLAGYQTHAKLIEALGFIEEGRHGEGISVLEATAGLVSSAEAPRLHATLLLTEIRARRLATDQPDEVFRQQMDHTLERARQYVHHAGSPNALVVLLELTAAELHLLSGRPREAVQAYREAMHRVHRVYPPTSRRSARLAHNLSVALLEQGESEHAEAIIRDTIEALERTPGHPQIASLHRTLGMILDTRGHEIDAEVEFETALALLDGDRDSSLKTIVSVEQSLAVLLYKRGEFEAARARLEQVLDDQIQAFGEQSMELLWTLDLLAEVSLAEGEPERARRHAERRLQLAEQAYGDAHPHYALAQMMLGKVLLELRVDAQAGPRLRRAHRLLHGSQADPIWRAESAFHLARHLHRSGHADRARPLVAEARALLAATNDGQSVLDEVEQWVRDHEHAP